MQNTELEKHLAPLGMKTKENQAGQMSAEIRLRMEYWPEEPNMTH